MDFRDTQGSVNDMATDAIEAAAASTADTVRQAAARPENADQGARPLPYPIEVDHSRDELLTEFGKDTLKDRYLLPGEGFQDLFARVASAYADDAGACAAPLRLYLEAVVHAGDAGSVQRRHRPRPADLLLSQFGTRQPRRHRRHLERKCLARLQGGGIGTYWGNVRGIGEPVGLNGKTSGIIPFVRVMDSLTLAISQGSLRRGSAACYLDISHPEIEEFLEIRKPSGDFNRKALNLHHGVLITDEFMEAVRDGAEFELHRPRPAKCAARSMRAACSRSWSKPGSRPASRTSSSPTQ